jgi:hypothetical protein
MRNRKSRNDRKAGMTGKPGMTGKAGMTGMIYAPLFCRNDEPRVKRRQCGAEFPA